MLELIIGIVSLVIAAIGLVYVVIQHRMQLRSASIAGELGEPELRIGFGPFEMRDDAETVCVVSFPESNESTVYCARLSFGLLNTGDAPCRDVHIEFTGPKWMVVTPFSMILKGSAIDAQHRTDVYQQLATSVNRLEELPSKTGCALELGVHCQETDIGGTVHAVVGDGTPISVGWEAEMWASLQIRIRARGVPVFTRKLRVAFTHERELSALVDRWKRVVEVRPQEHNAAEMIRRLNTAVFIYRPSYSAVPLPEGEELDAASGVQDVYLSDPGTIRPPFSEAPSHEEHEMHRLYWKDNQLTLSALEWVFEPRIEA